MSLKINQLDIRYKNNHIIKDITTHIPEGSFFTILGKSGSGKSTILKAIAGLVTPSEGNILMNDEDITQALPEFRKIGFVFQKPHLFPHLTIAQNIAFGPEVHGWDREKIQDRVSELMSLVQIEGLENRMPNQVSGGQQQRAAIARALALNHKLILMDEPFSSLDPYLREDMGQLIKKIQKELNLTVIFVTHDVNEVMFLSDRICFLSEGKLIQCGTPEDLYNHPANREIAVFLGDVNWIPGRVASGICQTRVGDFPYAGVDNTTVSMLLRPHDLAIDDTGDAYTVISSERYGSETKTLITDGSLKITVASLEDHIYPTNSRVGLSIINDYKHFL